MPEDRDREDDRFSITGANPHAPALKLARSLGSYKGRRPHVATAIAGMALLLFAGMFVVWLLTLLRL